MESVATFKRDTEGVDWDDLKRLLSQDDFDNGRTAHQLRQSFENSHLRVFAVCDGHIIGKARALSDGVCNGYIVDVWTYTPFRKRGIATEMMRILMADLDGQHVLLTADEDSTLFYERMGFENEPSLSRVAGRWLQNESRHERH